jgi:hypothetical protein
VWLCVGEEVESDAWWEVGWFMVVVKRLVVLRPLSLSLSLWFLLSQESVRTILAWACQANASHHDDSKCSDAVPLATTGVYVG